MPARAAGAPFAVQSGPSRPTRPRSSTFNRWVLEDGYAAACLSSARRGHSEHQLGTVLDLKTPGGPEPWYVADWGRTKAGAWIRSNAWRYGLDRQLPEVEVARPRRAHEYEPWHVRYFGRTIARKIHDWSRARERRTSKARRRRGPGPRTDASGPKPTPTPTVAP